jgi:hypothetical protein
MLYILKKLTLMNYIKRVKLRVHYASFVTLSKEVGHDGMVTVNRRLSQLIQMRDSGESDNELLVELIDELNNIEKQELKSDKVYALNWMIEEIKKFQKTLSE